MAFSRDNRWVVTGSADKTAMLWDVGDRKRAHRIATLPYDGDADRWFDPSWLMTGAHALERR